MYPLFALLFFLKDAWAANVLYIAPVASPSHHIWNRALAFGLAEKGHHVTMLSHDEEVQVPKNFTLIVLEGIYKAQGAALDIDALLTQTPLSSFQDMAAWAHFCCEYDMTTKGLATLLNYPKDFFDLVIFDITLGQCLYPLIDVFGSPPVVAVTPFLLPPVHASSFGHHWHTSYMPYYNSQFTTEMDLMERVLNFVYVYAEILYRNYVFVPRQNEIAKKKFGQIRSLAEIERSMELLLCNIDPVFDYPQALPPNIVPVGGLHVRSKELPMSFQEIMKNAKHGVVLFALGTNLRADKLDEKKKKALLEAFSKIPQTVLWKFEDESLAGLPRNVFVKKWLPQSEILAHPKIKLFISHGGALSVQEAMYHGVPVLGIPIFTDQLANVAKLVHRNLAKSVDLRNVTSEILHQTLTELLDNPTYSKNMKKVSELHRSQVPSPLEKAIYWVEYMLQHKSVRHLIPKARDMPFYQTSNLDVLAVLLVVFLLPLLLPAVLCRCFVGRRNRNKEKIN